MASSDIPPQDGRLYGAGLPTLLRQIPTFAVALLGGYLFDLADVPLGWMIGALVFSALFSWGFAVSMPPRTRPMALVVLGASFGTGASPEIIAEVIERLPWMVLASLLTLVTGALLTRPLAAIARLDPRSAFFCAVPGGVTVMPVLAEAAGADTRPVTLSQTMRMVLVVLLVPPAVIALGAGAGAEPFHATSTPVEPLVLTLFLAASLGAAYAMKYVRAANPWILGPLFLSIGLTATFGAPSGFPRWMIALAQVAMGAGLGVKLNRSFVLGSARLLIASALSTLFLGLLLGLLASVLARASGLSLGAVLLGMAPGGTPEMVVTAAALEVAVPMVLAFHLVRMVASNVLIAPMWAAVRRKPGFGRSA
ncbi:AbrB family transcriptional regulator [Salipiger abyssi]|uniref:AbrB family transcriptional regulator n=1 Tax=Salipiger abyssi TaxID=1250539 RepID=UPI001A8ECB7C|nr:AbrB family transcriptional regulator [Salipiger abyssi]MBN9887020.1 AbrB family transcriptional regulator [Salipiger abyssi]